jgi:hypothetical protein
MMPMPWEKICFYADATPGTAFEWFTFTEKETDLITGFQRDSVPLVGFGLKAHYRSIGDTL